MNKKKLLMTIAIGVGIEVLTLLLATVSFTYSWFSASVTSNEVKDQVVETGTLSLRYVDGPEIKMENIRPGTTITKTVYVANTGTLDASYNLVWQELTNEIQNDEMVIEATCTRIDGVSEEENGTCTGISSTPISFSIIKSNVSIEPNILHKYDITITFIETKDSQNYNQGKNFSGVLGVNEYKTPTPVYCTYDGELEQGTKFTKGIYSYSYKQVGYNGSWYDADEEDGWGVILTDKTSTAPVTETPCSFINNKPIVYTSYMFEESKATSIDLSEFYTSNVIDMIGMFGGSKASTINVSGFDTSKVTNMMHMFADSSVKEIKGLEYFNTANVIAMVGMFQGSQLSEIDVSSFNTSKVDDMSYMFSKIPTESDDASGMSTSINDKNYLARKLITTPGDDSDQGVDAKVKIIGLNNFDTSNVTNMSSMFMETLVGTLDLSSFDTSKVTDMYAMFYKCNALKTIYASDKFVFTSVEKDEMFAYNSRLIGGAGTKYSDSNPSDKTYARIDGGTTKPGYFTAKPN